MAYRDPESGASLDKGQFEKLRGKRLGQTLIESHSRKVEGVTIPAGYYVKDGALYKYNWMNREDAIESKFCIPKGQPGWRGDPCVPGSKKEMIGPDSQYHSPPRKKSLKLRSV